MSEDNADLQQWTAVERVILQRRSIRAFKKKPLPDFLLRRILEAGRFAPSAGNCQPWKFVVVNNAQLIAEMERDAIRVAKLLMWGLDYTRSPTRRRLLRPLARLVIRIWSNEFHPVPMGLLQQIARDKAPAFHGAPTLILLLEDCRGVSRPAVDIGICGQNMVLAAHSLGLGTCWVSFCKPLIYDPRWRQRLGLRYPYQLVSSIATQTHLDMLRCKTSNKQ